jgi:hypothetical protein
MYTYYISFEDVTGRMHQGLLFTDDTRESVINKITGRYLIHIDSELIVLLLTEAQIYSRWTTKEIILLDIERG